MELSEKIMALPRFDLTYRSDFGDVYQADADSADDGEWVNWDDVAALVAASESEQKPQPADDKLREENAQLKVKVQDYYTRWQCERENPTSGLRLDTWQAVAGKSRCENQKLREALEKIVGLTMSQFHTPYDMAEERGNIALAALATLAGAA